MFTGIIQATGEVASVQSFDRDKTLTITVASAFLKTVNIGDSIAVNGVCLTVTKFDGSAFVVDVSHETLQKTALQYVHEKARMNLEKSLTLSTPLGGHLVLGHVDGVGKFLRREVDGHSQRYYFSAPAALQKYIAAKGSITVQGISLTVNHVDAADFDVSIIAHTEQVTNIGDLFDGDDVNLEIDIIARYVERLLVSDKETARLQLDNIREMGW